MGRQDKGLGGVLAGTSPEYAVVTIFGTPGLCFGPLVKN
jgi:hypothetical protein